MSLSPKQTRFVEEYLVDLNAAGAVVRAGYSKRGAKQKGYELREMPKIQAAITAAIQARSERTETEQDEVLREIHRLGFSNIADYVEWGPDGVKMKDSADMSEEALRCVLDRGGGGGGVVVGEPLPYAEHPGIVRQWAARQWQSASGPTALNPG